MLRGVLSRLALIARRIVGASEPSPAEAAARARAELDALAPLAPPAPPATAQQLLADLAEQHRSLRARLTDARERLREFHENQKSESDQGEPEDRAARLRLGILHEERVAKLTADLLSFQRSTLAVISDLRARLDEQEERARTQAFEGLSNPFKVPSAEAFTEELEQLKNRAKREAQDAAAAAQRGPEEANEPPDSEKSDGSTDSASPS